MSRLALTPEVRAAAERWGARPEVWAAVHDLHVGRAEVAVETTTAKIGGVIVGISNRGFTVGHGPEIPWPDALAVVGLRSERSPTALDPEEYAVDALVDGQWKNAQRAWARLEQAMSCDCYDAEVAQARLMAGRMGTVIDELTRALIYAEGAPEPTARRTR